MRIRLLVLLLLFVVVGVVASIRFPQFIEALHGNKKPPLPPPLIALTPEPKLPRGNVLWLSKGKMDFLPGSCGAIFPELFRQAMGIAARDQLGLQTRDENLREFDDDSPESATLVLEKQQQR